MIRLFVFALALLSASAATVAQTLPMADEVLNHYVAAIGGKDALGKVQDVTVQMSAETERGAMMMTRKQKLPNMFSMVINAGGMEVFKQTSDGQKVMMGGMQGSRVLDGPAAQQMIAGNMLFPELTYTERGIKSTVAGIEKIGGKDAYKLTHTTADGATSWTDFFDVTSGLKVQTVTTAKTPQGEMTQTMVYSDFKDVNGVKFPFTIVQQTQRGNMELSVDSVKINKGLKESDFAVKE